MGRIFLVLIVIAVVVGIFAGVYHLGNYRGYVDGVVDGEKQAQGHLAIAEKNKVYTVVKVLRDEHGIYYGTQDMRELAYFNVDEVGVFNSNGGWMKAK